MTPQELLLKAADHIEAYGFTQGIGWVDLSDEAKSLRDCPSCTGGALAVVVSGGSEYSPNFVRRQSEKTTLEEAITLLADHLTLPYRDVHPLGLTGALDCIVDWNDAPGRTKDEVVTALRQAAG